MKLVVLKMLPFDNKSEFQVVVDMPAGTPLEKTARGAARHGRVSATVPEVTDYQAYAGTARADQLQRPGAPVLPARGRPSWATCRSICVDKHQRDRKSHDIAAAVRAPS